MKTSDLENQTLNVNATMSNTDKQGLHRSSVEEVEISEETMRTISNQPFIYQQQVCILPKIVSGILYKV